MSDVLLPDLGEGLTEATIVSWHVAEGEEVELNQTLAEVETAKAVVELPSPRAGRILTLHAAAGETLAVGAPLVGFAPPAGERQAVLVGYGPALPGTDRPRRRPRSFETVPFHGRREEEADHARPRAMPPVRKRARDLGVDLDSVHGTGPRGRILRADVEARAGTRERRSTLVPVTGLRRETARAMTESARTAPQAAVFSTVDVTTTLEHLSRAGRDGRPPSFLAAVCRAILPAAGRTPAANARFDAEAGHIEQFAQVELGIAVATDRGLLVASLPEAGAADAAALTEQIATQAARARDGSLPPGELTGSTLTVTNVGVFGVDGGIPLLNPGQSTIVAVGAIRTQPWEHRGEMALRKVVTLTVSFDHRVLDGAEASAFLTDITDVLSDPAILLTR
ncbi:dihydrolipoamide acetyltransferase family protein [Brachybacterium sacelli]|uniref:Dihydrolipoamide acetyltransferase component of pyruvate dehydrogenase complex n=1 Tax=Brachybacterium sacelli TaxID=173364 RepID=A0ABS4WXE8_9MICO|nr:dihydrolipoamide acetyltransferase family protein [Brachybacterium sacelli]MBP2380875.1 pyruvate dehydrogenase E2 component (dihydrolipoamide acetyltransferase) [Brachybacterium sacelli]